MNKQERNDSSDFNTEIKLKGFKVYLIDKNIGGHNYNRKDFYKISLNTGNYLFHYADKSFETKDSILFFGNPRVPYSCEVFSHKQNGYACVFTEDFLKLSDRSESLLQSPLFKIGGTPVLQLNKEQKETISDIFRKMVDEQDTEYAYKDDLIRNYINLIIHEALKMQPPMVDTKNKNAALRITSVFLDLLERQFPIESLERPLELTTAKDFAKNLSVHINYLNRSVKEITGKPTTTHITERVISEAKALLLHTDWNIADIAYSLGFEYPTYFNNYFKKMTGTNPKTLRV